MSGHLFKEPPSLADPPLEVPPDVDRAIRRALAKAPIDRYASPSELAACLAGALAGEAVDEPKPTSGPLALEALALDAATTNEPAEGDEMEHARRAEGACRRPTSFPHSTRTCRPTRSILAPDDELASPETASIPLAPYLVHRRRAMPPIAAAIAVSALAGRPRLHRSLVRHGAPTPRPSARRRGTRSHASAGARAGPARGRACDPARGGSEPPSAEEPPSRRATAKADDTNRSERRDQAQARARQAREAREARRQEHEHEEKEEVV
jgi:hypothetical protein